MYEVTEARCWWRSWLRHCATSRKVAGSILDDVISTVTLHNEQVHNLLHLAPWGASIKKTDMGWECCTHGKIEGTGPVGRNGCSSEHTIKTDFKQIE